MADGEGQDHQEGIQEICLLDGHMARRWRNAKCPYRELRKDGYASCLAEGQEDEVGSIGNSVLSYGFPLSIKETFYIINY